MVLVELVVAAGLCIRASVGVAIVVIAARLGLPKETTVRLLEATVVATRLLATALAAISAVAATYSWEVARLMM